MARVDWPPGEATFDDAPLPAVMRSDLGKRLETDDLAQRVFLSVLVDHLSRHGATSAERLKRLRLEFFRFPLDIAEILDLLELSRRQEFVKRLDDSRDAYGNKVVEAEWGASPRGRQLKPPRALTLKSFREVVVTLTPVGPLIAGLAQLLILLLSFVPVVGAKDEKSVPHNAGPSLHAVELIALGALTITMAVIFVWAMAGDTEIRHAAQAWKRIELSCPRFHCWLKSALRPSLAIAGTALIAAPPMVAIAGFKDPALIVVPYAIGWILTVTGIAWRTTAHRELESFVRATASAGAAANR